MTYEQATAAIGRDEKFRATIYAMNALMQKKGFYTPAEFKEQFLSAANLKVQVNGYNFIKESVAEHYHIHPDAICEKSNCHNIVLPRQVAMYLCHKLLSYSLPMCGRLFGGKHHTTVLYAIDQVQNKMERDDKMRTFVHGFIDRYHDMEGKQQ